MDMWRLWVKSCKFYYTELGLRLVFRFKLDTRITGGKPETFIRKAKLIMVDIDKENSKRRGLNRI